jgi:hypothetical protein
MAADLMPLLRQGSASLAGNQPTPGFNLSFQRSGDIERAADAMVLEYACTVGQRRIWHVIEGEGHDRSRYGYVKARSGHPAHQPVGDAVRPIIQFFQNVRHGRPSIYLVKVLG